MNKTAAPLALSVLALLAAAGLFAGSLGLPLWHLKMEAPQYQDKEALQVHVYPGSLSGDLKEIQVLNQYVGVHVPQHLPQLRWLPIALLAAGALGLAALALPRGIRARTLFGIATALSLALLASAGQAQSQMHQIGHNRNPHAALKGVADFTPPILGRVKVANFEISTRLGLGALAIGAGLLLQVGAGLALRRARALGLTETSFRSEPGCEHSRAAA